MSESFSCHCEERKKPVLDRDWVVIHRHCNYSAFNGYHQQYSKYSEVYCRKCHRIGRTKAKYVSLLKDGKID